MKAQVSGVIIIDVVISLNSNYSITPKEITVQLSKLDFELHNSDYKIIEIGTTSLTPTVKTSVSGINFDESGKSLQVIGADGHTVLYTASTNNRTVLVRVDFSNNTITVYE